MAVNRGLFNWGVFLVAAGVVALGFRAGLFSVGAFAELGRLWPLALIALGIVVLAGHIAGARVGGAVVALLFGVVVGALIGGGAGVIGCPAPGDGREVAAHEQGTLESPATVTVRVACGELALGTFRGNVWSVDNSGESRDVRVMSAANQLTVTAARARGFPFSNTDRSEPDWRLTLPAGTEVDLRVELNAGEVAGPLAVRLNRFTATINGGAFESDLREGTIGGLSVTVNAGSFALELPAGASFSGNATTNAGSFKLCLPTDAAIRIRQSGGAGSNNFAEFGLTRSGSAWESSNYATATSRIDLAITVNAGSAELEQSGECT
jgi:hypothetical protein